MVIDARVVGRVYGRTEALGLRAERDGLDGLTGGDGGGTHPRTDPRPQTVGALPDAEPSGTSRFAHATTGHRRPE